jgi:hydrogenase maturation protease
LPAEVLVIGFGNPAREDDGLGPAAAEMVEKAAISGVTVDTDYQLSVEHAADAAEFPKVVFVDASVDGEEPFTVKTVEGVVTESFSSHSVSPQQVIGLAKSLFGKTPKGFLLGIRGYSFEMFREELSDRARGNLHAAVRWLVEALKHGNLEEFTGEGS